MIRDTVKVASPMGLNMVVAGILVEKAVGFTSTIQFEKGGNAYNAKSVLSVLGAGVTTGETIELICNGEDEEDAFDTIADFLEAEIGE